MYSPQGKGGWTRIVGASTLSCRPGFRVRQDPLYGPHRSFPCHEISRLVFGGNTTLISILCRGLFEGFSPPRLPLRRIERATASASAAPMWAEARSHSRSARRYNYAYSTLLLSGVSPSPWLSPEKALWTRSSRLQAKTEALGSIDYKSTVAVDDGSDRRHPGPGALSRRRTAG